MGFQTVKHEKKKYGVTLVLIALNKMLLFLWIGSYAGYKRNSKDNHKSVTPGLSHGIEVA